MRKLGIALACTGLLVGCGNADDAGSADSTPAEPTPSTFTVTAEVVTNHFDFDYERKLQEGEWCKFSDLVEGAQVVITDGTGAKVGLGDLGPGAMTVDAKNCSWDLEVADVPTGGGIYTVTIAEKEMGSFTEAEGAAGLTITVKS